jgi:3-deoxy-D-manno-octulosonate 8-phosphate phosphatase (KDO 8-P phosphatase)
MPLDESRFQAKLKAIKLMALGVDGVLADGRLILGEDGCEFKSFDVKDGFGIRALLLSGIKVAVITGRESEVVKRRCEKLGIKDVHQGVARKGAALAALLEKHGVEAEDSCFMGDDANDLAVLRTVGLAACPADAVPEVREACDYVATRKGGRGAVREVAEMVLKAQGKWDAVIAEFS